MSGLPRRSKVKIIDNSLREESEKSEESRRAGGRDEIMIKTDNDRVTMGKSYELLQKEVIIC